MIKTHGEWHKKWGNENQTTIHSRHRSIDASMARGPSTTTPRSRSAQSFCLAAVSFGGVRKRLYYEKQRESLKIGFVMMAAAAMTTTKSTNQNRGAAPPSEIMEAPERETTYGEINGMSTTASTIFVAKAERTAQRP